MQGVIRSYDPDTGEGVLVRDADRVDLVLAPDEFWVNDDGLALHYEMYATVKDPTIYGPEYVGKVWRVEVMSLLKFRGDQVYYEADFHERSGRAKSLGIPS